MQAKVVAGGRACIAAPTRPPACSPRPAAPAAAAVSRPLRPAPAPGRFASIRRRSSDTGAENDDQLVSESGKILQGKQHLDENAQQEQQAGPMSEDKRGSLPEQGGAPEGDRAVMGQEFQPTGEQGSAVASPEAGEKQAGSTGQDAGQAASGEAAQQEDRTPLQD